METEREREREQKKSDVPYVRSQTDRSEIPSQGQAGRRAHHRTRVWAGSPRSPYVLGSFRQSNGAASWDSRMACLGGLRTLQQQPHGTVEDSGDSDSALRLRVRSASRPAGSANFHRVTSTESSRFLICSAVASASPESTSRFSGYQKNTTLEPKSEAKCPMPAVSHEGRGLSTLIQLRRTHKKNSTPQLRSHPRGIPT